MIALLIPLPTANTVVSVFGLEPFRIGGGERFVRELSRQLGDRGWRSVLCFLTAPPQPVRQFLQLPNVSIEVVRDSFRSGWIPAADLARILRRYRPSILHLHFTGFLSPYPWLAKLLGTQRVLFTDQTSHPEGQRMQRAALWKRVVARAVNWPLDWVICPSDYGTRCQAALGLLPPERVVRIHNSTNIPTSAADGMSFRQRFRIPADRTLVIQVSWIIPEKGLDDLLEAARIVLACNPNVHFAFVGEGAYREQYTERTAALGIEDHVTWTGLVQDPVGEGVYAAGDIVCQVSRWEEAFGWVIAEAMAAGKPVVGTSVGGIPEVIEDGKTGFVVPRRSPAAVAEKILILTGNRELRESMGRAGRAVAEAKFDVRKNVADLLRLYRI